MKRIQLILFIGLLGMCYVSSAQQKDQTSIKDTLSNFSAYQRKLGVAGVLQTRYVASLENNTDLNGKNFDPNQTKTVTNTFMVKRARVMLKADINDHFSANILANLAEFNGDPANKVLENAYIRYNLNEYFKIQAGQFRPFFGIEDIIPVDIIRSLDFSNQYYAFGKNGWQSFQTGLSIFGNVIHGGRVRYFAGAYNGNNKNQVADDNNSKNLYGRLEADLVKKFTLGINAASGSLGQSGLGRAYGIDATVDIPLSKKLELLLSAEYKSGANFLAYNSRPATQIAALNEYTMQGFYFFPTLRLNHQSRRLRAIEFSSRYEYFDENKKMGSNPRHTIIPNLSLIFADDFYAALQMGVAIDIYKTQVPLTIATDHSLAYLQLQIRF